MFFRKSDSFLLLIISTKPIFWSIKKGPHLFSTRPYFYIIFSSATWYCQLDSYTCTLYISVDEMHPPSWAMITHCSPVYWRLYIWPPVYWWMYIWPPVYWRLYILPPSVLSLRPSSKIKTLLFKKKSLFHEWKGNDVIQKWFYSFLFHPFYLIMPSFTCWVPCIQNKSGQAVQCLEI